MQMAILQGSMHFDMMQKIISLLLAVPGFSTRQINKDNKQATFQMLIT